MSTTSEDALKRIAGGSALNLVGAVAAAVAGLVLVAIVTNGVAPAESGRLFALISAFLIAEAVVQLGVDTGLARFLLRFETQGRHGDVRVCVQIALRAVVLASCLCAVAVFLLAEPASRLLGIGQQGAGAVRILAVFLPIAAIGDTALAAHRALGTMWSTVVSDKIVRSLGQPVAVLVALQVSTSLTLLACAWVAPFAVNAGFGTVALFRDLRRRVPRALAATVSTRHISAEFWRFTSPRAVARVSQIALQRVDIILVAALSSPAEAALYTAATRFVVLGQFGVQAVQQVLQPRLSQLLAVGDEEAVARVFQVSTAWVVLLAWPVYLTTLLAAPLYLRIFGAGYVDSGGESVVVALSLAMLLATAAGSVDVLQLMAGRSLLSMLNSLAALAVDVGLNIVLIPRHGAFGAALAWCAAIATRNLLPFIQVRLQLGITAVSTITVRAAFLAVGCIGLPLAVARFSAGPAFLPVTLAGTAGAAVYAWAIWLSRETLALGAFVPTGPRARLVRTRLAR